MEVGYELDSRTTRKIRNNEIKAEVRNIEEDLENETQTLEISQRLRKLLITPTPRELRYRNRTGKKMADEFAKCLTQLTMAINKLGNRPQITLPAFVGKLDKRSFISFIRDFNKLATASSWNENEMCQNLPVFLKSEASSAYDELDFNTKRNWRTLLDELSKRLGSGDSVHTFRRQIQNRKQKEGESFFEFGQFLSDLAEKAFPDSQGYSANMRKNMVIELFLNGVRFEIREHLRRMDKPDTLSDAISKAMEEEQIQSDLKREKITSEQIETINNLALRLNNENLGNNYGNNYRGRGRFQYNNNFFQNRRQNFNNNFQQNSNRQNPNYNRNWNFPPPQQYYGRQNYGNFGNNGNNHRGNWGGRGRNDRRSRGRGGYRINSVQTNSNDDNNANNTPFTTLEGQSRAGIVTLFFHY